MRVLVRQVEGKRLEVRSAQATLVVDGTAGAEEAGTFRSVELLLAALGSCMIGTMLTKASSEGLSVRDAQVELTPIVTLSPERVSRIRMKMTLDGQWTDQQVAMLREAAESCKVHNSLHAGVDTVLEIVASAPEA